MVIFCPNDHDIHGGYDTGAETRTEHSLRILLSLLKYFWILWVHLNCVLLSDTTTKRLWPPKVMATKRHGKDYVVISSQHSWTLMVYVTTVCMLCMLSASLCIFLHLLAECPDILWSSPTACGVPQLLWLQHKLISNVAKKNAIVFHSNLHKSKSFKIEA